MLGFLPDAKPHQSDFPLSGGAFYNLSIYALMRLGKPVNKVVMIGCNILSHRLECASAISNYLVQDHSVSRGGYVANSEAKFNVRHGHWRCCRNGHETSV